MRYRNVYMFVSLILLTLSFSGFAQKRDSKIGLGIGAAYKNYFGDEISLFDIDVDIKADATINGTIDLTFYTSSNLSLSIGTMYGKSKFYYESGVNHDSW